MTVFGQYDLIWHNEIDIVYPISLHINNYIY